MLCSGFLFKYYTLIQKVNSHEQSVWKHEWFSNPNVSLEWFSNPNVSMRSTCSWVNTPPQRFQNIPNLDQYRLRWHSDNQGRISSPPNAHVFVAGAGHFFRDLQHLENRLEQGRGRDGCWTHGAFCFSTLVPRKSREKRVSIIVTMIYAWFTFCVFGGL